jgi:hypothetical protein
MCSIAGESCFTNTGISCPRARSRRVSRTSCISAPDMCDGVITCNTRRQFTTRELIAAAI